MLRRSFHKCTAISGGGFECPSVLFNLQKLLDPFKYEREEERIITPRGFVIATREILRERSGSTVVFRMQFSAASKFFFWEIMKPRIVGE